MTRPIDSRPPRIVTPAWSLEDVERKARQMAANDGHEPARIGPIVSHVVRRFSSSEANGEPLFGLDDGRTITGLEGIRGVLDELTAKKLLASFGDDPKQMLLKHGMARGLSREQLAPHLHRIRRQADGTITFSRGSIPPLVGGEEVIARAAKILDDESSRPIDEIDAEVRNRTDTGGRPLYGV